MMHGTIKPRLGIIGAFPDATSQILWSLMIPENTACRGLASGAGTYLAIRCSGGKSIPLDGQ
nr:hypothetical protein [Oxalobacteraceae bacterium]